MDPLGYQLKIENAVILAACVRSRAVRKIIAALKESRRPLGITALCRKTSCSRRDALRYLSALVRLGAVGERRPGTLRLFKLLDNSVSAFMLRVMEHADRWDADGRSG